ncbi:MAG: hypothetical protein LBG58_13225 [Planctomycetaceae bacterium]|jgi:hypothetical protein|nr:hypothetical protein [Planctomycetaceae bacterium]
MKQLDLLLIGTSLGVLWGIMFCSQIVFFPCPNKFNRENFVGSCTGFTSGTNEYCKNLNLSPTNCGNSTQKIVYYECSDIYCTCHQGGIFLHSSTICDPSEFYTGQCNTPESAAKAMPEGLVYGSILEKKCSKSIPKKACIPDPWSSLNGCKSDSSVTLPNHECGKMPGTGTC